MKLALFAVLTLLLAAFSACRRADSEPQPQPSFEYKAGKTFGLTYRNPDSYKLEREILDSVVAPFSDKPDSLITVRVINKRINPSTGLLERVPGFPSVQEQLRFARLILGDTSLNSGPDPINFTTLNRSLRTLDLTIGDLFLILDTTSSYVAVEHYDFILEASKKLGAAYPNNIGYGSDFEYLLRKGKLTYPQFASAVSAAGLTNTTLLDKMAAQSMPFTTLCLEWLKTGDSTTSGLTNYLRTGLQSTRREQSGNTLSTSRIEIVAFGQGQKRVIQTTGITGLFTNAHHAEVGFHVVDYRTVSFAFEMRAGYNGTVGFNNIHLAITDAGTNVQWWNGVLGVFGYVTFTNLERSGFQDANPWQTGSKYSARLYFHIQAYTFGFANGSIETDRYVYAIVN